MARPDAIISPRATNAIRHHGRRRRCRPSTCIRSVLHLGARILQLRVRMLLRAPRRRQQIDKERQYVKGKDERDDPLEHRRDVLATREGGADEDGGKGNLDEDESELEPEGEAQDAVLAEMHAEALVLGADEDGADDVAGHEEEEEAVVQAGVVERVEDGEQDEAAGSGDGEDDCASMTIGVSHVNGIPRESAVQKKKKNMGGTVVGR